jgi:kynurenine formamidase
MIVARSATPGKPTESPFGNQDHIGMLNLVTAGSMSSVLADIDARKVYDLAVEFSVDMPCWTKWGDPPFTMWMTATPDGGVNNEVTGVGRETMAKVSRSSDAISMFLHLGTHVDTLNHMGIEGVVWNCWNKDQHLGSQHWLVGGSEHHPPIVARGVLLDVAGAHDVDMLPDHYGIGAREINALLSAQGVALRPGDVVLLRTGRMSVWPDADRYLPGEPGLNLDGARLLAEAGVVMVGADNVGLEHHPASLADEPFQPVHTYLLTTAGVPILENVFLEELAADGLYEFAFIGACLRIRGATGSPMRPMAFPLRST